MSKLIIFSGAPGTGKSTLSYKLAKEKGLFLLSKDAVDRGLKTQKITDGASSYQVILELCKLNLSYDIGIIVDACMTTESIKKQLIKIGSSSETFIIECVCSNELVWREKIDTRKEMVEGWTPVDFVEAKKVKNEFSRWEQDRLVLDSIDSFDKNYKKLLEYIGL